MHEEHPRPTRHTAEHVLPLKRTGQEPVTGLAGYLRALVGWMDVTVVDGSVDPVLEQHARAFPPEVRHLRPEAQLVRRGGNGKVHGLLTGVAAARHERVVIADDDVRYRRPELERVPGLLEDADLVRPQNYFAEPPGHARWDTGRALLTRDFSSGSASARPTTASRSPPASPSSSACSRAHCWRSP